MANAWFHYKVIDSLAVCLKKVTVDPVDVPISQADFVTGEITDPTFTAAGQSIFVWKYTGTQSNGSTDGAINAVNDAITTYKAKIVMSTNEIILNNLAGLGYNPQLTTTNDTVTNYGNPWELLEGKRIFIDIGIIATRTDSFQTFSRRLRYEFWREVGGSTTLKDDNQYWKEGPGLRADILIVSNDLQVKVRGKSSQTWEWLQPHFEFELGDLP